MGWGLVFKLIFDQVQFKYNIQVEIFYVYKGNICFINLKFFIYENIFVIDFMVINYKVIKQLVGMFIILQLFMWKGLKKIVQYFGILLYYYKLVVIKKEYLLMYIFCGFEMKICIVIIK